MASRRTSGLGSGSRDQLADRGPGLFPGELAQGLAGGDALLLAAMPQPGDGGTAHGPC